MNSSKLSYRAEIDGLRAIAVVSIILYHAQMVLLGRDWFEGGFIGVDLFFVISGYLITRIILSELASNGSFSFLNFYERRARRILPMLFVVIFVSIPYAWQTLLPSDFVEYAQSIFASLFFGSNFFFYFNTTEYGAESALLKPFLHTWSLGVEEQFYLVFPILTIIAYKYFCKYFLTILIGLSLLSLQFSELMEVRNSDLNFYLPFSRFWELAVGSMLAYRELYHKASSEGFASKSSPMIGLCLIAYSILFFDGKTPHPSFYTLIPIIGAALIIGFASKDELVGRVFGSKPFVWVGLISYSAYLWHFPIFAFSRIGESNLSLGDKFKILLLTLVLSVVSYFVIEKPFRKVVKLKSFIFAIFISTLVVAVGFFYVIKTDGVATKFRLGYAGDIIDTAKPVILFKNSCESDDVIYSNDTQFCVFGQMSSSKVDFLLVGDSHAMHAQPLLYKISNRFGKKGIYGGQDGCPPLLGIYSLRGNPHPNPQSKLCYDINQDGYEFVKANGIKTVLLIARWDYYVDGANKGELNNISDESLQFGDISQTREVYNEAVKRTFEAFRTLGVKVVVVLQVPHQNINVKRSLEELMVVRNLEERRRTFREATLKGVAREEHLNRQKIASFVWRELADTYDENELIVIDPTDEFCDAERCKFIVEDFAVYTDFDHPSEQAYDRLETKFVKALGW
tara:strand:+ start:580 stop:2622 length:2043 start_codon:yes stop_codon:yes gene_type:complete